MLVDVISKGRSDWRGGVCCYLATQQAYLVPDSSVLENSQRKPVRGGTSDYG